MVASKRRATDASDGASSSKKARTTSVHHDAQSLIKAILAKPDAYPILDDEDAVRRQLVKLAQCAQDLEDDLQSSQAGPAPKSVTSEQLPAAVEKLRRAVNSGITKQMSWKLSRETGSAKWAYDGVCADPLVFGALLGLEGPPKFKTHKIAVADFHRLLGGIRASVRYDRLCITGSHVNVRWSDGGEIKFSGTYGKQQCSRADR